MNKVYTYSNPRNWRSHSKFNEIHQEIHLCATSNMLDGIKSTYVDSPNETSISYVFTIKELINEMVGSWNSSEYKLKQHLILSRIIANMDIDNKYHKMSYKKNIVELLDTIRFLTITGVTTENLEALKLAPKEKILYKVWCDLEELDSDFSRIRNKIKKGWHKNEIYECLNRLSEKDSKVDVIDSRKIILHGFYFITPEQQVFLKALEKAGFEIIFFNLYNQDYPDTFSFVKNFISKDYGWEGDWYIEPNETNSKNSLGAIFLSDYEEKIDNKRKVQKSIIKYDSFIEFLNEIILPNYPIEKTDKFDSNIQIIATNADMINEILIQYYPERFEGNRNFLQYPVGKFLSNIHQMLAEGELVLTEEILLNTFSSGWLYNPQTGSNARDYVYCLREVLPFFENCKNVNKDWLPRYEELKKIYSNILPQFTDDRDSDYVQTIGSPFKTISHLSLSLRQLNEINFFINQLIFLSNQIFDVESEGNTISNHFLRLKNLFFDNNNFKEKGFSDNEIQVIYHLGEKMKDIKDDNYFLYDDVGEALQAYLSGQFSDYDNTFIKPFIEVDGEAFKSTDKRVYLTGIDEHGLPLNKFDIPWPLEAATFDKLSLNVKCLELFTLRNKSVKRISRYLFYIATEFLAPENLEISWMKNYLDRENVQPAVYARQLGLATVDYLSKNNTINSWDSSEMINLGDGSNTEKTIEKIVSRKDNLIDYYHCPKRFYYNIVAGGETSFSDKFIHQFLYTHLVSLVKATTTVSEYDSLREVGKLFPHLTSFQKEMAAKYFSVNNLDLSKEHIESDVAISNARHIFQYPGMTNKHRSEMIKKVTANESNIKRAMINKIKYNEQFEAKPGEDCKYCPFLNICSEGKYSID